MTTLPFLVLLFSIRALTHSVMTEVRRVVVGKDGPGNLAHQALVAVFLAGAEDDGVRDDLAAAAGWAAVPGVGDGHTRARPFLLAGSWAWIHGGMSPGFSYRLRISNVLAVM
jgi:hypothetical protein